MDIDKWTAEKCGIIFHYDGYIEHSPCETGTTFEHMPWTMQDARCRELVREHFKIGTTLKKDKWLSVQNLWRSKEDGRHVCLSGEGDTIEAAETACIEAIMKADDN